MWAGVMRPGRKGYGLPGLPAPGASCCTIMIPKGMMPAWMPSPPRRRQRCQVSSWRVRGWRWPSDPRRPSEDPEQLPQKTRRQGAQRIDGNRRILQRPHQAVARGEQAAPLLRAEQLADKRDVAEQRVEEICGDDGALDVDPLLVQVDAAFRRQAERAAERARVVQLDQPVRHP